MTPDNGASRVRPIERSDEGTMLDVINLCGDEKVVLDSGGLPSAQWTK